MNDSSTCSRRQLIQGLAALAVMPMPSVMATGAVSKDSDPHPAPGGALPWVPGLQLYTLQLTPKDDLQAALNSVAAAGYRIVELDGHYGRSAAQFKRMLDAAGLKAPSAHVAPAATPDNWDLAGGLSRLAADMHTLGVHYIVMPIPLLPDRVRASNHPPAGGFDMLDEDDWKKSAEFINEKAAALAREGFRMAYHNHGTDFSRLPDGKTGYDIMVERLDPRLVDFELDVGWAAEAGQDIGAIFKRLGSRLRMLHLKDTKRLAADSVEFVSTDAGTGIVDWQELKHLVRHSSVRYLFAEHEPPYATTPLDAARTDFNYLAKLFGAPAPR